MRTHIRPRTLTTVLPADRPQTEELIVPDPARPLHLIVAAGQCVWFLLLLPFLLVTALFLARSKGSEDLPQSLEDQWE